MDRRRAWRVPDRLGPGYRLYLTQDGDQLVILFVGGTKERQPSDIGQASALLGEHKGRKAKAKAKKAKDQAKWR
jgi:hypothetical protein